MTDARHHWDDVYANRAAPERSWYEPEPSTSLGLIERVATAPSAAILDMGAGASSLVDHLLDRGYTDVTVLDVSRRALDEVQERLGDRRERVTFLCQDLLSWEPDRTYELWHDRAVFHFLTDAADRDRYVDLATRAAGVDGHLIVGTFAGDGPTHCSGLEVARYTPEALADVFAPGFERTHAERHEHLSPSGIVQPFSWVVLHRARPTERSW